MPGARRVRFSYALAAVTGLVFLAIAASAPAVGVLVFAQPVKLDAASSKAGGIGLPAGTEPRIARGPDGRLWVMTNGLDKQPEVFGSNAGGWQRVAFPHFDGPSPDVDIVVTRTGRLIATDLTSNGYAVRVFYSDDNGKSWTESKGTALADQDRPWLAVGPDDPQTHKPRVYLLFHNLFSGLAVSDMFVSTSRDGGRTFGRPVPIVLPGDPAFGDLACAGSSGPSGIAVDQTTGRIYTLWGTRTSKRLGACGAALPPGSVGISVEPSSRIWVGTSPDGSLGSWSTSLAVDESESQKILGMLFASIATDSAGNVYVAYPETPHKYPDYSGAAVKYRWAPPDLSHWSAPVIVAGAGGAGHIATHVVAGTPGRLGFAFLEGVIAPSGAATWFATAAQTLDGLSESPHFASESLASFPSYAGTATELAGACGSGATAGVQQASLCPRATDNFGLSLDADCEIVVVWPAVKNEADGTHAGTWLSRQTGSATLCG